MTSENMKHNDCVNFIPVDAAKGFCRVTNSPVFIDTETCGNFKEACKCRNCNNFINPGKDNVGTCIGLKKEAWTFAELNAVTCEGYKTV